MNNNLYAKWSKEELDFLVENQSKLSKAVLAKKLNRTRKAIISKLQRIRREERI